MTTALIILPLAAALVVWLLPLPGRAAGAIALLAALADVALWAVALGGFDFEQGLQLEDRQSWFSDLGVSYHVGFYGFSLWLAGLAVVVGAAAIGYALWVDRERGRAYHGLLLFLTGSIEGVTLGAREAGGALGEAQTGYLRSYAFAIAAAVAVLIVVFITVQ